MTLLRAILAWGSCPACGSKMGTNSEGVETCSDRDCPYYRGGSN